VARVLPLLLLALAGCGGGEEDAPDEVTQTVRDLKLVSVGQAKVDGDEASVRAVIDAGGVRAPRLLRLVREDGRWKLAGGTEG
jgi:hypothetical protein